jgi:hypothetical protein
MLLDDGTCCLVWQPDSVGGDGENSGNGARIDAGACRQPA